MKGEKLRIAILSPPWFPVPPTGYGGIEWIVSLLADGLADQGHEVTIFASGDSRSKTRLAWVYEHAPSELIGRRCLRCGIRWLRGSGPTSST
jgi:hypothetical protein